MATINYNLNKIYGDKVHVPRIAKAIESSPLYALNDCDEAAGDIKLLNRTPDWIEKSKTTYNSPTNVRRLILTDKWVAIEFYKPYIVNGQPNTEGKWRCKRIGSEYDFDKAKQSIIRELSHSGDMAYGGSKGDRYTITGNMLSTISSWVLSNVEEIIVDDTPLFSGELAKKLGDKPLDYVYSQKSVAKIASVHDAVMNYILKIANQEKDEEFKRQFPRLKLVAMVPGLGSKTTLESNPLGTKENGTCFEILESTGLINASDCIVRRFKPANWIDDGSLKVRTYYKFDKEILSEFARRFSNLLAQEREAERRASEEEAEKLKERNMTELEKRLIAIEQHSDLQTAQLIYTLTVSSIPSSDRVDIVNKFTKNGLRYTQ